MQKSIEERRREHRRGAIAGVVFFGCIQVMAAACFAALCLIPDLPGWAVALFAALAVLSLLLILPVLKLLKQRFEEIEGGELDEACQY